MPFHQSLLRKVITILRKPASMRLNKKIALAFICSLALIGPVYSDEDENSSKVLREISELKDRIEELELVMEEVDERQGDRPLVQAFDGLKVDLGGFIHSTYTYVEGENSSVGSFNRQNFELLLGAELTKNWSAFFAGGFLRESDDPFVVGTPEDPEFDSNSANPLVIGWVNYQHNDFFNIRLGRISTPHGIINIEHFPASLLDPEQPQFLRPFSGNTIFPNFSTGAQLHGRYFGSRATLGYTAYFTNANGESLESNSEEIFGGRVSLASAGGAVELGLNYSDSFRAETNSDNTLYGVDLNLDLGRFSMKAELFETSEDVGQDRSTFYIQPAWNLSDDWIVFYRYDELEKDEKSGQTILNVVGVNYLPHDNVRLRVTYSQKQFNDRLGNDVDDVLPDTESDTLQLSGTFSF